MQRKKLKAGRSTKPARLERRVRVTFFLVAQAQEEIDAVERVIDYLFLQYWLHLFEEKWDLPITGFTHSVLPVTIPEELGFGRRKNSIFLGHWWSEIKVRIHGVDQPDIEQMEENVVLFVIDLPTVAEEWKFDEGIVHLKEEIFSIYAEHGSPQEEIWIVKQDIHRYA